MPCKSRYLHPRDEIMQTMERIYHYRMTTTSGGNLSIREPGGDIWITPAGIDKGALSRDDIVCVRADGTVDGHHPPSSEFPFHKAIYEARPDLEGIVHAHPVALVAFSVSKKIPDTRLFHQSRHVCGEIGFAPYSLPGSESLGSNIADEFHQGRNAVIMENHGVVTGGQHLQEAFERFETLEFTAKTIIKGSLLGTVRYLDDAEVQLPRDHAKVLPEFSPPPPDSQEKEMRRQLSQFVKRGYQQRLLISTEGSFSARLGNDTFLITPYQVDRKTLTSAELVLVKNGAAEAGKIPSRATSNHRAIYQKHPFVGAVVNAYTVNASAFSVTGTPLDTRTIPESYLFLRQVARLSYGVQFRDSEALAEAISQNTPICLLENDGVLVTGKNILDTFDRLEVLESTAEAIINSRPLGEIAPMSQKVIEELELAFFPKAP